MWIFVVMDCPGILWRRWMRSWSFYCLVGYMRFERDLVILVSFSKVYGCR